MNRIRKLRKEKGYTLEQVAKSINVTNMTISRYERGEREPKIETWQALADFYGVSVPYLQGVTYCKKCDNYFFEEDHYGFCPYCGISLEERTYINRCLDCGTVFFFDAPNYCPLCGGQRFE